MSDFLQERLIQDIMIFDGGIGSEIYRRNFFINTSFENLCLASPRDILDIHKNYVEAGVDVLTANSFGANRNKLARFGLADKFEEINTAAVKLAKEAAALAGKENILVAGSVGPIGEINRDAGEGEEYLKKVLEDHALILEKAGADFLIFESVSCVADAGYAAHAAQKIQNPYIVSFTLDRDALGTAYQEDFSLFLKVFASLPHPPAAIGLNCGAGPESTLSALRKIVQQVSVPLVIQPNAGKPKQVDGRTMYLTSPEYLTTYANRYMALGARGLGGCCGISPAHISDMARSVRPLAKSMKHIEIKIEIPEEETLPPVPMEQRSTLGAKLAAGKWVNVVEVTPPRGVSLDDTVAKAIECRNAGFDAVNLPDGPRASCRISPLVAAIEIQEKAGLETILHCCCRDRNLIGLQANLLGAAAKNINNILFVTGDPPKLGDYPFSSGVFDADSIGMVKIASRLNQGLDIGGKFLKAQTKILSGVGADPNAIDLERELRRLREKVEAGAEFIITQPVFDPESLFKFLKRIEDFRVPVIAGIWPLASYRNAEFMRNEVPGVVVPDEVMRRMLDAGADKAAQRAAGIAIAREAIEAVRSEVQGVATSAPFGSVKTAIEVIS